MSTYEIRLMPNPGVKPGCVIAIGHDAEMSGVMTVDQFCEKAATGGDLFFEATQQLFSTLLFAVVDSERFLSVLPATLREEYEVALPFAQAFRP